MRKITTHLAPYVGVAADITIEADERDEKYGNSSHLYLVCCHVPGGNDIAVGIPFQHGPIKEAGVNGLTNEVLLAIVIDRLEGFQSGDFPNEHNQKALDAGRVMLDALFERTRERLRRGVEGTYVA